MLFCWYSYFVSWVGVITVIGVGVVVVVETSSEQHFVWQGKREDDFLCSNDAKEINCYMLLHKKTSVYDALHS